MGLRAHRSIETQWLHLRSRLSDLGAGSWHSRRVSRNKFVGHFGDGLRAARNALVNVDARQLFKKLFPGLCWCRFGGSHCGAIYWRCIQEASRTRHATVKIRSSRKSIVSYFDETPWQHMATQWCTVPNSETLHRGQQMASWHK